MENQKKIIKFKNWIIENKIDLTFIFWAEKLILKKCNFTLCQTTPNDILEIILLNYFSKDLTSEIKEFIETLINFTLGEYFIFGKYDFFTITISCIYFVIYNCENLNENNKKECEKQFNILLKDIDFINKTKIEDCVKEIVNLINMEENEENSNNETDDSLSERCITRTNSTTSLIELFTSFDKKYVENLSPYKLNEKKEINFLGKKRGVI